MKINDKSIEPGLTLDDVEPGTVVRLDSGKLYMVVVHSQRLKFGEGPIPKYHTRQLVNLQTGASWTITNGDRTNVKLVDATLTVV